MTCPREVAGYMERARRAIDVAETLVREGYPGDAVCRAYFAMFYAAQALLRAEDIHVTRHAAVVARFGEHFAKTGRVDPRFHRMLIDGRKAREVADYALDAAISEADAGEQIEHARAFVAAIETVLGEG